MAVLLPLKHMCHAQELAKIEAGLEQEAEHELLEGQQRKLVSCLYMYMRSLHGR